MTSKQSECGFQLRKLRIARGWRIIDAAKAAGISPDTARRAESSSVAVMPPIHSIVVRLATVFGAEPDLLREIRAADYNQSDSRDPWKRRRAKLS